MSSPAPFGRAEGVWNLLPEQPWNQLTDGRGSVLTVESSTALERITEAHALRWASGSPTASVLIARHHGSLKTFRAGHK